MKKVIISLFVIPFLAVLLMFVGMFQNQNNQYQAMTLTNDNSNFEFDDKDEDTDDTPIDDNTVGGKIVSIAKTKKGCPYTWGATGPNTFDCSGFVYWVHNQAGIKIPRLTASGYSNYGKAVKESELQPGDVVTFFGYGYVCHIGIYIGNGNVIHAAGQANEINGQWGGKIQINKVSQVSLKVHNYRRLT